MGFRSKLKAVFRKRSKPVPSTTPPPPPSSPTPLPEYLYVRVCGHVLKHERRENTIQITGWAFEIARKPSTQVPTPSGTVISIGEQTSSAVRLTIEQISYDRSQSQVTAGFKSDGDSDIKARFRIAEIANRSRLDAALDYELDPAYLRSDEDVEEVQLVWLTVVISMLDADSMYPMVSAVRIPNRLGDIKIGTDMRTKIQRVLNELLRTQQQQLLSVAFPEAIGDRIPTLDWIEYPPPNPSVIAMLDIWE